MTKLQDKLRKAGVFNDADFFGDNPYIWYRPAERVGTSAWMITKRGVKLSDFWAYPITVHGRADKSAKLEEAKAYLAEHFKVHSFARSPFGAYGDADWIWVRIQVLTAERITK